MNKLNNKELLELLKTDVKTFNLYREEYPNQKIDFSHANLSWINLSRADLGGANLEGANLEGANIGRANLRRANLDGANLEDSKITLTRENIDAIKGA